MPMRRDDEWEDDGDNDSDAAWHDEDDCAYDEEPTIACPGCCREIYEDAPQCPHCGRYVSDADAPTSRKPWWIVVGAVTCLYICYRWVFG
jgi:hypothetical protein